MNNYNSNYNDDLNRDYFGQNPDIERQNGYTGNNSMNNPNSTGPGDSWAEFDRAESPSVRHPNVQDSHVLQILDNYERSVAQNASNQGDSSQNPDKYSEESAGNFADQNANNQADNQQNPGDVNETANPEQKNQNGAAGSEENIGQSSFNTEKRARKRFQKYLDAPSDQMVIFSSRAYNAIISETFAKHPYETGGVLLGYVLDNGYWIVTEVIPPGKDSINRYAYFEYDTEFVNYVANRVAIQYKIPPQVLGLWHRHPGSMDSFSGTDDGTNYLFASDNNQYGAISGLVNIDPQFRFTLYHVTCQDHNQVQYQKIGFEVGDDFIPENYFQLSYFGTSKPAESYGENDLVLPDADSSSNQTLEQNNNNNSSNDSGLKYFNATLEVLLIFLLSVNIFLFLKPAAKTGVERLPQTSEAVIQPAGIQQQLAIQQAGVPSKVQSDDPEFSEPVVGKSESEQTDLADEDDSLPAVKFSDIPKQPADNTVTLNEVPIDDPIDNSENQSALETQLDQVATTDIPTDAQPTDGAQESPTPSMYRAITDEFENQTTASVQTDNPER